MGDTLGVVLVTPFLLAWFRQDFAPINVKLVWEDVLLTGLTLLVGQIIFLDWLHGYSSDTPMGYWLFLCISLVAIRMGLRGATFNLLMIAILALTGAYQKVGFFAQDIEKADLHNYWAYMLVLSIIGMALSTYINRIKQTLEALKLKDAALDAAANSIIITDLEGRIEWANVAFSRVSGYSLQETIGQKSGELVKSGKHDGSFYQAMWETILNKQVWRGEIINRSKDGTLHEEEMTITPLLDEQGDMTHFVAVKQDIAERKRSEFALRQSEERTRLAVMGSNSALWDFNLETGIVYLSESWSQFLGGELKATETTLHDLSLLVPEEEQDAVNAAIRNAIKGIGSSSYQVIHRVKKPDGDYIWVRSEGHVTERDGHGRALRMSGINRNITERKKAEDALRESEEKLRGMFEMSPLGIALTDMQGRYIEFNSAFEKICGYSRDELNNLDYWTLTPKKYEKDEAQQLDSLQGTGYYGPYEKEYIRKDGKLIPIQLNGMLINGRNEQKYIWSLVEDISGRKLTEAALRESEARFRLMFEQHSAVMVLIAPETGEIVDANTAAFQFYGYLKSQLIGMNVCMIVRECSKNLKDARNQVLEGEKKSFEFEHQLASGEVRTVEVHTTPMTFNGKSLLFSIIHDISERKLVERELGIAATAFESREGILVTDILGQILRVNAAFTQITGYTAEEVIGKNPRLLNSGHQNAEFYTGMWAQIHSQGVWEGEIINRRKNGEEYPEYLSITAVKDAAGNVRNYVATFADISARKTAEEAIRNLAFYDTLTGLPNRRLLLDRLLHALSGSARSGQQGALMFIDMDNFKNINDTLGHDIGDILLKEVASRLTFSVREGDTVARLGGDEFVVMLENLGDNQRDAAMQARKVGEKLLATLGLPYQLLQHERLSSASIGVTLFNAHQDTQEELLKRADIAMYQSKKAGRNTLHFFDPQMQEIIDNREALERGMLEAIEKQQFQLYYQIQMDSDARPLGAEVLIRWLHPVRGMITPAEFLPLAEETKLILPLGRWLLETVCAQLYVWKPHPIARNLVLSINISPLQFRQADFIPHVQATLQHYGINPALLKLELTESLLHDDVEASISTMKALNEMGLQFSLDDFGTGYSSLRYLKQLPLAQLKIDQVFVGDIVSNPSDRAIVSTIIAMAKSLNLQVIAEGVEVEEQRVLLEEMGCRHYQGYLFGKPLPIKEFELTLMFK
jgi:diguanylate cyclase (GGDEF)-like protein/PAS domain S-box-containing protein